MNRIADLSASNSFKTTLNWNTIRIITTLILGSLILPQCFHLIPKGGIIFLPIYFFTIIGAYRYGLKVGLLLGVFSPVANYALFGMPYFALIPMIIVNSIIISIVASYMAKRFHKNVMLGLLLTILSYQLVTYIITWISVDFRMAWFLFIVSFPSILFQLFGGYFILKYVYK